LVRIATRPKKRAFPVHQTFEPKPHVLVTVQPRVHLVKGEKGGKKQRMVVSVPGKRDYGTTRRPQDGHKGGPQRKATKEDNRRVPTQCQAQRLKHER
jgi:hypothetical protein